MHKSHRIIQGLFFISLFINLTIPKAGIYLRKGEDVRIPFALGSIIFSLLFLIWLISNTRDLKNIFLGSTLKKIGVFYIFYTLLRYCLTDFTEYKYIGRVIVHYIVYGGYLLVLYLAMDMARFGRKIIPVVIKIIVISMCIVSLYGLMQVFFDSQKISLAGITETYGSPEELLVTYIHNGTHIEEGSASMKNLIATKDNSGKTVFIGRKVFSTFHHGNLFGSHLVLFAPVIFSMIHIVIQKKWKIVYFCLGVSIFLSLLFANSRGALIGFLGSCLTLFLISKEKKKIFVLLTLILLSGILLFNLILNAAEIYNFKITSADALLYRRGIASRYRSIFEIPRLFKGKLSSPAGSLADAEIEPDSADIKLDRVTNYRYRQFKKFYKILFSEKNISYVIFGRGYRGMKVYQNLYFNLFYNLGILGLCLFLYIVIYILWVSIKSGIISKTGNNVVDRVLVMGGISGIVGFLIHSLFDNLFFFPPFGINFWILGGLVFITARNQHYEMDY